MSAVPIVPKNPRFPIGNITRALNRPAVTMAAVLIGVGFGVLRLPMLEHLEPVGDFYIDLLQICVLPFLLATIPLAVRSALTSSAGDEVLSRLAFWLLITSLAAVGVALLAATIVFDLMPRSASAVRATPSSGR